MRLTPRSSALYPLFTDIGAQLAAGAEVLAEAIGAPEADRPPYAVRLREAEHACDELTHTLLRSVNSTFVTPFDREDIHRLASALDDVMDEIEAAADLLVLYRVGDLPAEFGELAAVLVLAARRTAEAMPMLKSLAQLSEYWIAINRMENEADQIYRRLLARLFGGEFDALTVMKLKDVADAVERAVDACEHAANTVESIAVKES